MVRLSMRKAICMWSCDMGYGLMITEDPVLHSTCRFVSYKTLEHGPIVSSFGPMRQILYFSLSDVQCKMFCTLVTACLCSSIGITGWLGSLLNVSL